MADMNIIFTYPTGAEGDIHWRSVFGSRILDPLKWKETAEAICCTLEVLRPALEGGWSAIPDLGDPTSQPDLARRFSYLKTGPVFLMLLAYALENLAKGLKVRSLEIDREKWDGKFPSGVKGHGVMEMVEEFCNPLSSEERDLLVRLKPFATWAGRYPGPLTEKELRPTELLPGIDTTCEYFRNTDIERGFALIHRLKELY